MCNIRVILFSSDYMFRYVRWFLWITYVVIEFLKMDQFFLRLSVILWSKFQF
jgi:hypothetical protein